MECGGFSRCRAARNGEAAVVLLLVDAEEPVATGPREHLQARDKWDMRSAYALVNAASEYAGDTKAPLMSAARVDALQSRCGSWDERVLDRYGPSLASGTVVDIKPGSMNAAGRLSGWAARSGASVR